MKILLYDLAQDRNIPDALKTPDLGDTYDSNTFTVTLFPGDYLDCIGIGNTDATEITFRGETITIDTTDPNGLYDVTPFAGEEEEFYLLTEAGDPILTEAGDNILVENITYDVTTDGTYLGRFGFGRAQFLGVSPAREPGFYSTAQPRVTASGAVVTGAGGITGRKIAVDVRYKIAQSFLDDLRTAFPTQIGKGFPFFIYFDKEQHRIPWARLYAQEDNQWTLQSSVNRMLYSRQFNFTERF